MEEAEKRDWRVGLTVKPKYRGHPLYYERGTVVEVLPSGTDGIVDRYGVLKIRMSGGSTILAGADDWITA